MLVVGLAGLAGAGKDTLAKLYASRSTKECSIIHFADTLKDLCHDLVGWDGYPPDNMKQTPIETELIGSGINNKNMLKIQRKYIVATFTSHLSRVCSKKNILQMVDNFYEIILKNKEYCSAKTGHFLVISPRRLYQLVGTDCCRAVQSTVWVDDIRQTLEEMRLSQGHDIVFIPDVRFDDEASVCDLLGWVERDADNLRKVDSHKSEQSLSKNMIDFTLHNKENDLDLACGELTVHIFAKAFTEAK
jgi:hypothetical protein